MLIGLTGKAGVGKSTVADLMVVDHKFYDIAFADSLKNAAKNIFGLPIDCFYDQGLKEVVDDYWGMSPRKMLQVLGTEACRNTIDQEIWVKSLMKSYRNVSERFENVVITDVRFNNEAAAIREQGGIVVHIVSSRGSHLTQDAQNHASEAGVTFIVGDWILDNRGTQAELPAEINRVLSLIGASHAG